MRWIIASYNYAPEATGIGKVNGELGAWLAAHGHDVRVVTAPPYYPQWEVQPPYSATRFQTETLDGVRVFRCPVRLPNSQIVSTRDRLLFEASFALSSLWFWVRALFARRADVVYCVCPPTQVGIAGFLYSRLRRVPWIFHVQDLQVDAALELGMLKPSRAIRYIAALERFLLRHATLVTTISEPMRQRIIAKGIEPGRVEVHRNWANLEHVVPGEIDPVIRRELGATDDQMLLMHAGNIGEKQGLDLMLDAAERLGDDSRFRFAIVGDGAARTRLEEDARARHLTNVAFLGIQPFERLPEVLRAADVHLILQREDAADLVMPSRLGNVLAAARPVIATAAEGTAIQQVIAASEAGWCVAPGHVDDLVGAITDAASDAERLTRRGDSGRRWAEAELDQDRILDRMASRFAQLSR